MKYENEIDKAINEINAEMKRVRMNNRLSAKTKMEILASFNNVLENINKIKEINDELER